MPESRFKVGDLVECVNNSGCDIGALEVGKTYEVTDVSTYGMVGLRGARRPFGTGLWADGRFKLAKIEPQVGGKVVIDDGVDEWEIKGVYTSGTIDARRGRIWTHIPVGECRVVAAPPRPQPSFYANAKGPRQPGDFYMTGSGDVFLVLDDLQLLFRDGLAVPHPGEYHRTLLARDGKPYTG